MLSSSLCWFSFRLFRKPFIFSIAGSRKNHATNKNIMPKIGMAIFAAMLDSPPPVKGVSIIAMPNAASVIPAKSDFKRLFIFFALYTEFVCFLLL